MRERLLCISELPAISPIRLSNISARLIHELQRPDVTGDVEPSGFFLQSCYENWVASNQMSMAPKRKDMATWTELIGHAKLRSFVDDEGNFWLEQNSSKQSKWGKLAHEGHDVAWEFDGRGGSYTGRMLVDGELYTPSEATKKFFPPSSE